MRELQNTSSGNSATTKESTQMADAFVRGANLDKATVILDRYGIFFVFYFLFFIFYFLFFFRSGRSSL